MILPTESTISEYRETYFLILENNKRILGLVRRYPVYLILAGKTYRFDSVKEFELFSSNLQKAIQKYGKLG